MPRVGELSPAGIIPASVPAQPGAGVTHQEREFSMTMGPISSAQQRSLKLTAGAVAFFSTFFATAFLAPAPAAASDNWAMDIINDAKGGENRATRRSSGTRVASLGNQTYSESDDSSRRTSRRSAAISSEDRPQNVRRTRTASRASNDTPSERPSRSRGSLSGGGNVSWVASASCLDSGLRSVVASIASNFGPVTVNSTCRSSSRNRAVGGAGKSYHLSGDAVDFRVHGNVSAVYAALRSNGGVGGLKHYGGGLFHIDTGPRRSW